jgi:hypothetical protein
MHRQDHFSAQKFRDFWQILQYTVSTAFETFYVLLEDCNDDQTRDNPARRLPVVVWEVSSYVQAR